MTQNPIQIIVETVDFASAILEEAKELTRQKYWEVLSFRISNTLQV